MSRWSIVGWGISGGATGLLGSGARPDVRAGLFEAVGNLAEVVGFCALDVQDPVRAERFFRFALECADDAGSWVLRAAVLADLARVHANAREVGPALSAIELAQGESDRLPPTARAMLHVMRARYLVLDRRPVEAFRQVELADEEITGRDPSGDPPWLQYYDLAEHQGSVGRALAPLAVASAMPDLAVPRLEAAVQLQAEGYPRSRVFSRIRLARLLITTGEVDRAVAAAGPALVEAAALTSGRVLDEFDQLLGLARRTDAAALRSLGTDIADHIASKQGALPMTTDSP